MINNISTLKVSNVISRNFVQPFNSSTVALASCSSEFVFNQEKYSIYPLKNSFSQISSIIVKHLGMPTAMCILAGKVVGANNWAGVSIDRQYNALKNGAGIFEASAMHYWEIMGDDAENLINMLSPRSIKELKIGSAMFLIFTTAFGSIDDEAVILKLNNNHFLISSGACKEFTYLSLALEKYPNVKISNNIDMISFNVKGPKHFEAITSLLDPSEIDSLMELNYFQFRELKLKNQQSVIVLRSKIGLEVWGSLNTISWAWEYILTEQKDFIIPCGWDILHVYRMECQEINFTLYPLDVNNNINLLEAGFTWMCNNNKSDYIGCKYLQAQAKVEKKLIKIQANSKRSAFKVGDILHDANGIEVGIITSGAFSPQYGCFIAFAHVDSKIILSQGVFTSDVYKTRWTLF